MKYMKFGTHLERAELVRKSIFRKVKHVADPVKATSGFSLPLEQYESCDNIILQ